MKVELFLLVSLTFCIAGARWDSTIVANILLEKQDRGEVLPTDPERPATPPDTPIDGKWLHPGEQDMSLKGTHVYECCSFNSQTTG